MILDSESKIQKTKTEKTKNICSVKTVPQTGSQDYVVKTGKSRNPKRRIVVKGRELVNRHALFEFTAALDRARDRVSKDALKVTGLGLSNHAAFAKRPHLIGAGNRLKTRFTAVLGIPDKLYVSLEKGERYVVPMKSRIPTAIKVPLEQWRRPSSSLERMVLAKEAKEGVRSLYGFVGQQSERMLVPSYLAPFAVRTPIGCAIMRPVPSRLTSRVITWLLSDRSTLPQCVKSVVKTAPSSGDWVKSLLDTLVVVDPRLKVGNQPCSKLGSMQLFRTPCRFDTALPPGSTEMFIAQSDVPVVRQNL